MKAIVYHQYGTPDMLHLVEVEKPVPKDDEVLIKIEAVSLNRSDWEGLVGKPLYARMGGLFKPGDPILGSDIAGRVEAAGANHSLFQPGDEVFGELPGYHGGLAEYACTRGRILARIPPGMSFAEAAAIPQAGGIALQGIRDHGQVQPGQKVLINGAGGGAGTFALQLAKLYGAEVTAVDNAGKQDFLRSLGADHVLDYTRTDFTRTGKSYDLILDVIAHRPASACARALRPNGNYYMVGGSIATLFQVLLLGPWIRRATGKNLRLLVVQQRREDLVDLAGLWAAGKVVPPVDRCYPLNQVPEALRSLGEGRARGKVVILVGMGSPSGECRGVAHPPAPFPPGKVG